MDGLTKHYTDGTILSFKYYYLNYSGITTLKPVTGVVPMSQVAAYSVLGDDVTNIEAVISATEFNGRDIDVLSSTLFGPIASNFYEDSRVSYIYDNVP